MASPSRRAALIGEAERLFRLDIDLVDARPDAVSDDYEGERRFYAMAAFSTLVDLFEREGALHEALEVAEHGARYGQCERRARRTARAHRRGGRRGP